MNTPEASQSGRSEHRPASSHPLRKALRKGLNTALKRVRRKEEKLQVELDACGDAERLRECGEILKAHLPEIKRGVSQAELPDMYHPGTHRLIEIEPRLKPMENAKRYFKQHRKAKKGLDRKVQELTLCREEGVALEAFSKTYEAWLTQTEPEDAPLESLLDEAATLRVHVARPKPKAVVQKGQGTVRDYISADGLTILVGKGARENDKLTFRLAKGQDWWFHVHQYAGSHVVVRLNKPKIDKMADKKRKQDAWALPQETLLDAAHLAAWFSKARGATKVEVSYTQAKNIHKRKGAPAGQVILNQSNSIYIKLEEKRLDRLLERRG